MDSSSDRLIASQLEDLQKRLGKKNTFEGAIASLTSLMRELYPSSPALIRKSFFTVVSRVATILKTRYTAVGFWLAGLELFQLAERLTPDAEEKAYLNKCISQAKQILEVSDSVPQRSSSSRGYLFEGHLTVDQEPPQPNWLVQTNLMNAVASLMAREPSSGSRAAGAESGDGSTEIMSNIFQELVSNLDNMIPEILDDESGVPKRPPASKEVVANLPIITLTEEILGKLGQGAECAICKENLVIDDKMQELPCKHTFHPPCLRPWLDAHNSCPICRHELRTDDHAYESWKEREQEAEEDRKGAANAVRGGEYMYV